MKNLADDLAKAIKEVDEGHDDEYVAIEDCLNFDVVDGVIEISIKPQYQQHISLNFFNNKFCIMWNFKL